MTGLLLLILIAQPLVMNQSTNYLIPGQDSTQVQQIKLSPDGSAYYVLQAGEEKGKTVYVLSDESEDKGD